MNRNIYTIVLIIVLTQLVFLSCAKRPKPPTLGMPNEIVVVEKDQYTISIDPGRLQDDIDMASRVKTRQMDRISLKPISGYRLFIQNKTTSELIIVWDETLFIDTGITNGKFMYAGIIYRDRNLPQTISIVLPKSDFQRRIYPNARLSLGREVGWIHSPIMKKKGGEYGVLLTLQIGEEKIREKLTDNAVVISNAIPEIVGKLPDKMNCTKLRSVSTDGGFRSIFTSKVKKERVHLIGQAKGQKMGATHLLVDKQDGLDDNGGFKAMAYKCINP